MKTFIDLLLSFLFMLLSCHSSDKVLTLEKTSPFTSLKFDKETVYVQIEGDTAWFLLPD
ncbi:MAG: hypothetical protein AAF587_00465 [Bacteroidota bacterium]